ncbi:hypothetical protein [Pseudomonas sp. PB106]|uniref:hypothetical protein n=1 Tax=Pseudomonas sp. PB106 TaxID=2494699 RepID=UPI00131EBD84|nr:hypothetical protein [Pseudomonas sp. PB106]KAE9644609.1 hypothetical protein EJA71_13590 [Pseudomonas sp. PB106]
MEFIGEADLIIRCLKPFYRRMTVKTVIHMTQDADKDQAIISVSLQHQGLKIAKIDVTLEGITLRFIVYSSSSIGSAYELHCYWMSD